MEPTNAEPTELVEPAEQAAQAAEATVARRSAAGQPSSAFVGVSWHKASRQWQATIRHNSKDQHLGYFEEEPRCSRDDSRRRADCPHWRTPVPSEAPSGRFSFQPGAPAVALAPVLAATLPFLNSIPNPSRSAM